MQVPKNRQKFAIRHHRTTLSGYIFTTKAYIDTRKKFVKQQYLPHMSLQYGELRATSGWDRSGSLCHPCKFQRVWRLGSVNARHYSSGRQPNFAALNRRCHLYSAGRPSRWALAHIFSSIFSSPTLSGRTLDVYHTSSIVIWCGPSANLESRSEMCWKRLAGNTGPKTRHIGTIAELCRAICSQLRNVWTIAKKIC